MSRKRIKLDDAPCLLALRKVPMNVTRKVVEALPGLEWKISHWHWRYALDVARAEIFGDITCTVELAMNDGTIKKWHIGRHKRVLRFLASESDELKRILQGMPSSPDEPWRI